MGETIEFSITRASQLTIPNKDWTHYRSGLKIRCSNGSLGVTLAVISQGKSIDTTMITASNVRFLTKEPIVGLKIFDGEKLRKRLQITFASEGNFNMFFNKINQWIGLSVAANYDAPDSQLANSQPGNTSQRQEVPSSQPFSGKNGVKPEYTSQLYVTPSFGSQNALSEAPASQIPFSQERSSQFVPSHDFSQQSELTQFSSLRNYNDTSMFQPSQSRIRPDDNSHNLDPFSLLLNAAKNDTTNQSFPQCDTSALSQSTQIWKSDPKDPIFQYPTAASNNNCYDQVAAGHELSQTLRDIPFNPGPKQRKAQKARSKKKNGVDDLLELTIARIIDQKQGGYLDLNDKDLSLKICRKLRSKSFMMLLKRVERLLN